MFLFLFFLYTCRYTEELYPSESFYVNVQNSHNIKVIAGNKVKVDSVSEYITYCVEFDSVRGGKTMLFHWVIKDTGNGYKYKRLKLIDNKGNIINEYSIYELKSIESDTLKLPL